MTDYARLIREKHPVRRSADEKAAFRRSLLATAEKLGWEAREGSLDRRERSRNLVVGDPAAAQVLLTAYYDTPAWSLFPDLRFPGKPGLSLLYIVGQTAATLLLAFLTLRGLEALAPLPDRSVLLLFIGLFIGWMLLLNRTFPRRSGSRNTADCALALSLMEALQAEDREKAAFLFLDDGERSGRGGKAWGAAHPDIAWRALILRLDSVGDGHTILLTPQRPALNLPAWETLRAALADGDGYILRQAGFLSALARQDRKQLPLSVGLTACRGWYIGPKAGTDPENIAWLTRRLCRWIGSLQADAGAGPAPL